ncbi:MAG: hypothetical protein EOS22_04790 [Mesorhizobium sp.]|uniref:hypothetical protein n=1 Tax=Mesorhizobium sp. TaxID=1871066 RepID=UPI000FE60792|nr:hypothetical protein [Mesorhizobium sp.]RWD31341.1 MAG: hypothetical protein EOS22_04790 [Mesorhizobium sp.]TJW70745.1 MAG: hypothetical protein E5V29_03275 [Mesorhizobium sp.]
MSNVDKQTSGTASRKKHDGKLAGKSLAFKALLIATGLSSSERRVAAAIVDHMNSRTGRCDPGMRRLAFDTGHQLSTVQQAVSKLTNPNDPGRFFDNVNPGRGKTPFYKIRWDKVEAVVDQFEARTRLPTVPELQNGPSKVTVLQPPNSDCSAGDRPTVRDLQNKTNLRTKGARPAAPQAAGPVRAPLKEAAEKNAPPTGPPFPLPSVSEEAVEVLLGPELPHTAMAKQEPSEASRARVSAAYDKFLQAQQPVGPTWPRGGPKRP